MHSAFECVLKIKLLSLNLARYLVLTVSLLCSEKCLRCASPTLDLTLSLPTHLHELYFPLSPKWRRATLFCFLFPVILFSYVHLEDDHTEKNLLTQDTDTQPHLQRLS